MAGGAFGPGPLQAQAGGSGSGDGVRWLPGEEAFAPLGAAPRETALRGAFVLADRPDLEADSPVPADYEGRNIEADVALGIRLPVARLRAETAGGPAVVVAFEVGTFSRFFMESSEKDLINTDFRVGLPISLAWRGWEARVAYRHISSHLGDDFIRRFDPDIQKTFSDDGFEVILARRLNGLGRIYAGGEASFATERWEETLAARGGLELETWPPTGPVRPFAAVDLRLDNRTTRGAGSAAAGLNLSVRDVKLRLEARGHYGPSPMGWLRDHDETYWGLGIRLEP